MFVSERPGGGCSLQCWSVVVLLNGEGANVKNLYLCLLDATHHNVKEGNEETHLSHSMYLCPILLSHLLFCSAIPHKSK